MFVLDTTQHPILLRRLVRLERHSVEHEELQTRGINKIESMLFDSRDPQ